MLLMKPESLQVFQFMPMSSPDHLHAITDRNLKPSEILRYINGIISRRVIDYLKEHGHNASLQKLKHETKERAYRYSLWGSP